MLHVRGAPYRPMTQRKFERWQQTLKRKAAAEVPLQLLTQVKRRPDPDAGSAATPNRVAMKSH
jgi:hypothetical protein